MIATPKICAQCNGPILIGRNMITRRYCSDRCQQKQKMIRDNIRRQTPDRSPLGIIKIIGVWRIRDMHRCVVRHQTRYRCQAAIDDGKRYSFLPEEWYETKEEALAWVRGESRRG